MTRNARRIASTLVLGAVWMVLAPATSHAQTTKPTSRPAAKPATPPAEPRSQLAITFAARIARAHGKQTWDQKQAVQADIVLEFGGNEMLNGTLIYDMHTSCARIELNDGTTLVFDGEKAWVSPAEAQVSMARFHLLTWSYFLAAPFKLADPGTHLQPSGTLPLEDKLVATRKLTFDEGVGDAPDDWYIIYPDLATNRLAAMAYIVSYGKSVEAAEEEPHAIVYHDYETIDGVALSMRWTMHHWSTEKGPHGDPIGEVQLRNVEFVDVDETTFAKPDDAREDKLPGS